MKKHLIAAAVAAAVAVPATAQVTVSGVIDSGYKVTKDQVGSAAAAGGSIDIKRNQTGMNSNVTTSTLNFSATEDLGGGLKATAFHNVQLSSNAGGEGVRDTWVSLGGGFGEFKIGRFTPAFETNAAAYTAGSNTTVTAGTADFMFGGALTGTTTAASALAAGKAGTQAAYADVGRGLGGGATFGSGGGVFQYTTPVIAGGLRVTVGFADSKVDNTTVALVGETQVQQKELALNYVAGPFSMGLAVLDRRDNVQAVEAVTQVLATAGVTGSAGANAVAASQTERDLTSFGISYNLGPAIVRIGHIVREDKVTGANLNTIDAVSTSVGLTIPMGANTFSLNVYDGDDGANGTVALQRDHEGYQLLAVHALSKRTSLYGVYGKNEYTGATAATSSSATEFAFGLRHSF